MVYKVGRELRENGFLKVKSVFLGGWNDLFLNNVDMFN